MRGLAIALVLIAACEPAKSAPGGDSPQAPGGDPSIDCGSVAAKIRATYSDAQRATFESEPRLSRWFDTTMRIVQESCEQDHWPEAVKKCALDLEPGDVRAQETCNQTMPAELQRKMQDRLTEAMKRLE